MDMNQNQMNQFEMQIQFLQNQINQLQNQMNQPVGNQMNQIQLNYLQMQLNILQNQLNQLGIQQMNQANNFNQMNQINNFNQMNQANNFNQMNNNIGMNFNNENNIINLNNNINNINPQPIFCNNNKQMEFSPFGIPQNGFAPSIQPNQKNYYNVLFRLSNGTKISCLIPKESSIQNMFQIFSKRVSTKLNELNDDFVIIYNAQKMDINSQMKVKELFLENFHPIININEINPSVKLTFKTSSGITTDIKYYGCICCSSFWSLLQVYLREIGLEESCLKDLQFIFKGKELPKDKNEASKYPSAKYGINAYETIIVIDTKNLIGEKMKNK